jgi:hypothetical protein
MRRCPLVSQFATSTVAGAGPVGYRRNSFLLPFLQKAEVDAIFTQAPVRLPEATSLAETLSMSRVARSRLDTYAGGAVGSLPPEMLAAARDVRSRVTFQRHYESKADFEFVSLPIESLLTPQWRADLEYVDELSATLRPSPDPTSDFEFCFPESDLPDPIVNGNTLIFSSVPPSIAITPVPSVRKINGRTEIVLSAEGRPNYVMAAELGGRIILENGVHHVLALWRAGRTSTYAVLKRVQRPEDLAIQLQSSLFAAQNYFQGSRPPLVRDFYGPAGVTAYWRATQNIYRVIVQVEQIPAPLNQPSASN